MAKRILFCAISGRNKPRIVCHSDLNTIVFAFHYDIATNKTQISLPAHTYKSRPPGPTTSPACAIAGADWGLCQTARTLPTWGGGTPIPSIRHNGRSSRRACGAAARKASHSASDSKFSNRAPKGAASRTATKSHAGVVGSADIGFLAGVPGTRPRRACGAGSIPARQSAISRSSRVLIRPIRPHTATSSTVKARSRAATTAIAACSPVRMVVKFNMRSVNICTAYKSINLTHWCGQKRLCFTKPDCAHNAIAALSSNACCGLKQIPNLAKYLAII